MRLSKYFLPTLREEPSEADIVSHKFMLRAGMLRKLASGIYSFLPLGLKTIKKVENIVREEMNRAGAIELFLPMVQPAELWIESKRWDKFGPELLRFKDRSDRDFCLGPTHEEVIVDLVRREIKSYKQLPINLYQIQVKFRDEIRPRFGVMRCREFAMKDAYSFDVNEAGLEKSYQDMYDAYSKSFERCGLTFKPVEADTGAIGGNASHEFMVLAATGEDALLFCPKCGYSANREKAEIMPPIRIAITQETEKPLEKVHTPNVRRVDEVCQFLNIKPDKLAKTLIYRYRTDGKLVAAMVRGDHELNEIKLRTVLGATNVEMATADKIEDLTGAPVGFTGPVRLKEKIQIVADWALYGAKNLVIGANEIDHHFTNSNAGRDFSIDKFADLRQAAAGDLCHKCGNHLEELRGIEVGHTFKLGTVYSEIMRCMFLDENGVEKPMAMGCYGIGIARTAAAAIEQYHDEKGPIWPTSIAPFEVTIVSVNQKSQPVSEASEKIYKELSDSSVDVLYDDRDERPGVKFADADLVGSPIRITLGEKNVASGKGEWKWRKDAAGQVVPLGQIPKLVTEKIREAKVENK